MIHMEFDESLYTGDAAVDAQHRELIGMFNDLHVASSEGRAADAVESLLQRLHSYTIEHFTAEQALMKRTRFPADEMLSHVEDHIALTQRVRQLVVDHREQGFSTMLPLATLLQEWLASHIRQRDRRLVAHVRSVGAEGLSPGDGPVG